MIVDFHNNKFHIKNIRKDSVSELMLAYDRSFAEANYFFRNDVSGNKSLRTANFIITPYALIGEKEKNAVKRLFYKNSKTDISNAVKSLGIESFIDLYEQYYNGSSPFDKMLKDIKFIKGFISDSKDLEIDEYGYLSKVEFSTWGGVDSINNKLKKMGLSSLLVKDYDDDVHEDVLQEVSDALSDLLKDIKNSYWDPLLKEFTDLVFFSLPYGDQNVESNKKFLKGCTDLGFVNDVLSKEYSQGKYFQEYFSVLKKESQKEFVNSLKSLPKNPAHDHFLWAEGFKDFSFDLRRIYKEDADYFIKYFKSQDLKGKKTLLKDIMDCEFTNEKVVKFLNKKYLDLVREVSFNG